MSEYTVRFHIYMLRITRDAIKRAAARRGMSANAWIIWHITEALEKEPEDTPESPEPPNPQA